MKQAGNAPPVSGLKDEVNNAQGLWQSKAENRLGLDYALA